MFTVTDPHAGNMLVRQRPGKQCEYTSTEEICKQSWPLWKFQPRSCRDQRANSSDVLPSWCHHAAVLYEPLSNSAAHEGRAIKLRLIFRRLKFIDTHNSSVVFSAAWRWLLFGLGWRQPQIVLLDHGLYVDLPEALRQNYCALWCSFLVNDMATATVVGQSIAGKPFPTVQIWSLTQTLTCTQYV